MFIQHIQGLCQFGLSTAESALLLVGNQPSWFSAYITSERADREDAFQSRIHGNVCLSPSDPKIYLHGKLFSDPFLRDLISGPLRSSGWFLVFYSRLVSQSQSHFATDGQSVSQSVSLGVETRMGLMTSY
jgi:hypothetical protein